METVKFGEHSATLLEDPFFSHHAIVRFDNGYGASLINGTQQDPYSNLWELAVISFWGRGLEDYHLNYKTPITSDVLSYLTEKKVSLILDLIKNL